VGGAQAFHPCTYRIGEVRIQPTQSAGVGVWVGACSSSGCDPLALGRQGTGGCAHRRRLARAAVRAHPSARSPKLPFTSRLGAPTRRRERRSLTRRSPPYRAPDLVLVFEDGLSALGVQRYTPALLRAIRNALDCTWRVTPLVIVQQARVAAGDEVGKLLSAEMVAMTIGERPRLSSPDSVGVYLTHRPRVGSTDARRNCISNIRVGGQDVATAARQFAWLAQEARRLQTTGVGLKDHSGLPLIGVFSEEPRRAWRAVCASACRARSDTICPVVT